MILLPSALAIAIAFILTEAALRRSNLPVFLSKNTTRLVYGEAPKASYGMEVKDS